MRSELLYPETETVWSWPWEAVPQGVGALRDVVVLTKNEIQVRLGGGGGSSPSGDQPAFTGPVGIAETTGQIVDQAGWRSLIEFTALMSLNLAVFNVLPIPALDGGRIFFVLVEVLRGGRRISPEKEAIVHLAGFVIMIGLAVVVTYFDIARLVT
jgi:regulator of sigma E protease